jgi:endogenous inhibitor of DNA gyrase (YacG/DUF329 family)
MASHSGTPAPHEGDAGARARGPRCPTCRREFAWSASPQRPFCSLTCRLIDLGVWLDEGYRMEAERRDDVQ